tara:strand:- start:775 stop:1083 length:309 start_codon:yes stop_codon:yes gene_type:complete
MERGLFNITSATTTTLIDIRTKQSKNISLRMTNTHASTAVTVDLFLEDESLNKVYILKTDIPGQTSLLLNEDLSFNNSTLALKLTTSAGGLSTSTPLSVIIK